jgi:replicative superfamily II helicase
MSGNEARLTAISQITNREKIAVKTPESLDSTWRQWNMP